MTEPIYMTPESAAALAAITEACAGLGSDAPSRAGVSRGAYLFLLTQLACDVLDGGITRDQASELLTAIAGSFHDDFKRVLDNTRRIGSVN